MIIDNTPIESNDKLDPKMFKDTTVNQVTRVQYEVDPVILELATNLETLRNLYHNRGVFEDFVKVANDLLATKYGNKNSLDILYENKDFIYEEETIALLESVASKITEIEKVSQNLVGIDEANANIEYIKEILPAINDILITSASIKDIQRIGRNIEKVRVLHTHIIKIITLFDSINELHTIYNYLPYLLKLSLFLENYSKLLNIVIERFDYYGKILDNHIEEFKAFNRHISFNLSNFESKIEEVIKRIEEIDASAIDQFRETLIKLEERVTVIEKMLEGGIGGGGTDYDDTEIRDLIKQLQELIANIQQSITNIENRLDTVEGNITNINTRIDGIDESITNINEKITNIEGNITNIEGNITNIEGDIENINNTITTINETINEIKQNNVKITAGNNITVDYDELNNSYTINSTATGEGGVTTIELKYSEFTLSNN